MSNCYEHLQKIVSGKTPDQRAEAINNFLNNHPECSLGEYTLQEIADLLGITRERVRQIETNAIKKLRHPKYGRDLLKILDFFST